MLPSSFLILIDATKRDLDGDSTTIKDWEYVKHVHEGAWSLKVLSWSKRYTCFSRQVKWLTFSHLISVYDTLVNYYECHEEALFLLKHQDIPMEITRQFEHDIEESRLAAIRVIRKDIAGVFPDIMHSINQHRADYYMLNKKIVFVQQEKL